MGEIHAILPDGKVVKNVEVFRSVSHTRLQQNLQILAAHVRKSLGEQAYLVAGETDALVYIDGCQWSQIFCLL